MGYAIADASPIKLCDARVTTDALVDAITAANLTLSRAGEIAEGISLELFDIIDLRMLSGLVGEVFVAELCSRLPFLRKNPNIDGYPDLLDVSTKRAEASLASLPSDGYIKFPFGGLEVKNTFGVKKAKAAIPHRGSRVGLIDRKLVWKAHHRETNNLIALQSDYVDRVPQIIAAFFSAQLAPSDWTEKQQPAAGSTMTSFCQTTGSGFEKLRRGLKVYRQGIGLEAFLQVA